ncbi:hypothetical protein M569_03837, partial [Genlisea aurea]
MPVLNRLGAVPWISSCLRRSYVSAGAAAVVSQVDVCFDDSSVSKPKRKLRVQEESEEGQTFERGIQWVIMGDPIVRRHLYARRLAELLDVPHISMGSLLRQELYPSSPLYKKISNAVNEGKLVQENVIFALLSKRLEEGYHRGETGFILDGIPRTAMQAEILDQVAEIDLVLNLKHGEESSIMKQTSVSTPSGINIRLKFPSAGHAEMDGIWKEKHAEQRRSVEEYYKQRRKLFNFKVSGESGETTWQGLLSALHLTHI